MSDSGPLDRPNPIAGYEDWPARVGSWSPFEGPSPDGTRLGRLLGVHRPPSVPTVTEVHRQAQDGIDIRRLRWSVGFGPETTAWLLRPIGRPGDLPGVVGMHCHGGVRSVGGEQLVELGDGSRPRARRLRDQWYAGRAPANELARRGFVVLVHDTFSWGSRRFDLSRPTPRLASQLAAYEALWREQGVTVSDDDRFDLAAGLHEDTIAKAAGAFGQGLTGAVLSDDLIALDVLAGLDGVDPDQLSTFGFSGGGGRSLLLAALDHRVGACVVACMMATFASLVPLWLDDHSWLLHAPGLWTFSEWPDLARLARARFLVQYRTQDPLFPIEGMESAHRRLLAQLDEPGHYRGSFSAGGHDFDVAMQEEAFAFLAADLS
jgi:dienelactone hydrolase